jgi:hypothetical protein
MRRRIFRMTIVAVPLALTTAAAGATAAFPKAVSVASRLMASARTPLRQSRSNRPSAWSQF